MPAAAEAHSILEAALNLVPREPYDNKGSLLGKAAGALRLSYWQAKKIKYREIKTVDGDKLAMMRERLNELQEGAAKRRGLLDELKTRTAELRSGQGSGEAASDRGGAAALGRRSEGEVASGSSEGGGDAAARSGR